MNPNRFIQTTLVSGDIAAGFIYVPAHTEKDSIFKIAKQLDIELLFGHDEGQVERTIEMAVIAIYAAYRPFFVSEIRLDARESDLKAQWVEDILRSESIIIANSPPEQIDFTSLARGASGAAIGAYVGWAAGQAVPRLCCTNHVRDSSRESSMVAGRHEQTDTPDLQDQELAGL